MTSSGTDLTALASIAVTTADGTCFTVRLLAAAQESAPIVLVLPAMALKAKFYLPLARHLHEAGLSVALCDLRGQGEARPPLDAAPPFGYREMLEIDLPAVVGAVRERFPDAPLYLFGHSLGGQLALLHTAADPAGITGVAVLGTGSVFWWAFGPRRWFEALWKIQAIGVVSRLRGRWPGGMLIGGAMSGRVMTDWARHSLTGRYHPHGSARRYDELIRELRTPVLVVSLSDDSLGPRSTVDYLCGRLTGAPITRWHLGPESGVTHRDHFMWIKDSAVLGPRIAEWIGAIR